VKQAVPQQKHPRGAVGLRKPLCYLQAFLNLRRHLVPDSLSLENLVQSESQEHQIQELLRNIRAGTIPA